ncbi:NucA/NucB deoxyribonuclease domain-containing protein [Cellulomonas sp. URHB0016]
MSINATADAPVIAPFTPDSDPLAGPDYSDLDVDPDDQVEPGATALETPGPTQLPPDVATPAPTLLGSADPGQESGTEEGVARDPEVAASNLLATPDEEPVGDIPSPLRRTKAPEWCNFTQQRFTRTEYCYDYTWDVTLLRTNARGVTTVAGTATGTMQTYVYMSWRVLHVINQTTLRLSKTTGKVIKLDITGKFWCSYNCDYKRGTLPVRRLQVGRDVVAIGDVSPTFTGGMEDNWDYTRLNWSFDLQNVSPVTLPTTVTALAFAGRCDVIMYGPGGCVTPYRTVYYMPTPETSPFPTVSRHVQLALASGLMGAPENQGFLSRTRDVSLIQANRQAACPRSIKRPTDMSCDEYPFASTRQGASNQIFDGGSVRVFDDCGLPTIPGSGTTGFSRCIVPLTENTAAGRHLGQFYRTGRVWDGDEFYVKLVDPAAPL